MSDQRNSSSTVSPIAPTHEVSQTGADLSPLEPLIPLAKDYLENRNRELEINLKIQERELEIQSSREERAHEYTGQVLMFEKYKFNRVYWFALVFVIAVLAISAGLIFVREDVQAGILVLSHVIAIAVGIFGGAGWMKSRKETGYEISDED